MSDYKEWAFVVMNDPGDPVTAFLFSIGADITRGSVIDGANLYVDNIDQDTLSAAWAAYDFAGQITSDKWQYIRGERTRLLLASDWTQSADAPDTLDHGAWATYRQALRDIPQTFSDPDAVVWPDAPALPNTAGLALNLGVAVGKTLQAKVAQGAQVAAVEPSST